MIVGGASRPRRSQCVVVRRRHSYADWLWLGARRFWQLCDWWHEITSWRMLWMFFIIYLKVNF